MILSSGPRAIPSFLRTAVTGESITNARPILALTRSLRSFRKVDRCSCTWRDSNPHLSHPLKVPPLPFGLQVRFQACCWCLRTVSTSSGAVEFQCAPPSASSYRHRRQGTNRRCFMHTSGSSHSQRSSFSAATGTPGATGVAGAGVGAPGVGAPAPTRAGIQGSDSRSDSRVRVVHTQGLPTPPLVFAFRMCCHGLSHSLCHVGGSCGGGLC